MTPCYLILFNVNVDFNLQKTNRKLKNFEFHLLNEVFDYKNVLNIQVINTWTNIRIIRKEIPCFGFYIFLQIETLQVMKEERHPSKCTWKTILLFCFYIMKNFCFIDRLTIHFHAFVELYLSSVTHINFEWLKFQ